MNQFTYNIKWQRQGDDEVLECKALSPKVAFSRLMGALNTTNNCIVVHSIECSKSDDVDRKGNMDNEPDNN